VGSSSSEGSYATSAPRKYPATSQYARTECGLMTDPVTATALQPHQRKVSAAATRTLWVSHFALPQRTDRSPLCYVLASIAVGSPSPAAAPSTSVPATAAPSDGNEPHGDQWSRLAPCFAPDVACPSCPARRGTSTTTTSTTATLRVGRLTDPATGRRGS